jgi:bifunctional non-homologous end joining protein LigD
MSKSASVRLGGAVITNPAKLFWPDEQLTKLDLARFYARIASHLLPWMKSRALTTERCPDLVRKGGPFRRQPPGPLPPDVATASLPSGTPGEQTEYVVGGTRKTLLILVNVGCIAVHVTNCRFDQPDKPDWLAFDLDPSDAFASAARAAVLLRRRLEDRGLESFVKTAGGKGLHVFVPLRRAAGQERVRAYAAAIARELAAEHPTLVTVESRIAARRAPVYLDVTRNAIGQTIVPPFSVRWRPRAPVSMPLDWDEVSPRLDPAMFNVRTAERRIAARAPWSSFFGHRQSLPPLI